MNPKNEPKSTYLRYVLACGCTLKQRVDYRNSATKRLKKTVISRIYNRNENQPANNLGAEYLEIIAAPKCREHYPEIEKPKNKSIKNLMVAVASYELTKEQAEFVKQAVDSRVRK